MPFVAEPNVVQTSTSGGLGDLALTGSLVSDGRRDLADAMSDGDTAVFEIRDSDDPTDWELTVCTYNSGAATVSRAATPIRSSNGGAKVNFSAGTTKAIAMVADPASVLVTRAVLSPAQVTGDQDDWAPTGLDFATSWLRVDTDASRTFTGLAAGVEGQILDWTNVGGEDQVLADQDASSSAANRFATLDGEDLTIESGQAARLRYDATTSRWRVMSTTAAVAAGGVTAISSNTTVTADQDRVTFLCDASGGAFTLTLPPAATADNGFEVTLVKDGTDVNAVTLDGDGSETIDGAATRALSLPGARVTVISDGSNWITKSGRWGFRSAGNSISTNGTITMPHGLGVTPVDVQCELVCQTADANYTAGERVPVPTATISGVGVTFKPDATNMNLRYAPGSGGSVFIILDDAGGGSTALTNGSWRLDVTAWAP
jgi:hypothetical protein